MSYTLKGLKTHNWMFLTNLNGNTTVETDQNFICPSLRASNIQNDWNLTKGSGEGNNPNIFFNTSLNALLLLNYVVLVSSMIGNNFWSVKPEVKPSVKPVVFRNLPLVSIMTDLFETYLGQKTWINRIQGYGMYSHVHCLYSIV